MLKQYTYLALALGIVLCAAGSFWYRGPDQRPHVVLIIVDTLRPDKLATYGYRGPQVAPELDALAASGTTFNRVIAQSSWTRPSHGSFLTSQYPRTLGLYDEQWDALPKSAVTLAELLKDSGYTTIGVTANPNINAVFGFNQGFDSYIDSEVVFHWMGDQPGKNRVKNGRVFENARIPAQQVFQRAKEEAQRLLAGTTNPLYLQLNIMEVHGGRIFPREQADPDLQSERDPGYLQCVRNASQSVGKFINEFEHQFPDRPTIFIITSDHGEGLSDHPGLRRSEGHGLYLYEAEVVVPWIIYAPKLPELKGKRVERQVRLLDLLPTVLELAHSTYPSDIQGVSLAPVIRNPAATVDLPTTAISETRMQDADKVATYGDGWYFIANRDGWDWLPPEELQAQQKEASGAATSQLQSNPDQANLLRDRVTAYEEAFTCAPAQAPENGTVTSPEVERLRSLGYLK